MFQLKNFHKFSCQMKVVDGEIEIKRSIFTNIFNQYFSTNEFSRQIEVVSCHFPSMVESSSHIIHIHSYIRFLSSIQNRSKKRVK